MQHLLKAFTCLLTLVGLAWADTAKPNIIYIIADDLGYSDLGTFGGEIETPNLDSLAAGGLRLTQFYNNAKCDPTRTALMSGLPPHQTGIGVVRGEMLPEAMRRGGYRTYASGKWHLRGNPYRRGFDEFFGFLQGSTDFFGLKQVWMRNQKKVKTSPDSFYATRDITNYALEFLEDSKENHADKPFFLYLAYNAPHFPLQAPRESIMKYRGRYLEGWDALRVERLGRMIELGVLPADTKLPPRPGNIPAWDALSPAQKDFEDLRMAVYAAMVDDMDREIGRVVAYLEETGQLENTLIVFQSDNGADPFDRARERMLEKRKLPGMLDSNWEPNPAWAMLQNTPLKMYKRNIHEGGASTSTIVHWPAGVKGEGRIDSRPADLTDWFPTFAAMAEVSLPEASEANDQPELRGQSLLPLFEDDGYLPRKQYALVMHVNRGIREGDWKLVSADGNPWELYDLSEDRTEQNNLITDHPELAERLEEDWEAWWSLGSKQPYRTDRELRPNFRLSDESQIISVSPAMSADQRDVFPLSADLAAALYDY